jgi:hypothetical protein
MDDYAAYLPHAPKQREIYLDTMNRTHYCRTLLNEQAPGIVDAQEPALPASLGDIPLVVLSAGANWSDDPDEYPPGATAEMLAERPRPGSTCSASLQRCLHRGFTGSLARAGITSTTISQIWSSMPFGR